MNAKLTKFFRLVSALLIGPAALGAAAFPALAQPLASSIDEASQIATYADLATLSDRSEVVVRAQIRRQTLLKPERAPGLAAGFARLFIDANTIAVISGRSALPASLTYLVDVPLDAKGKVPRLKARDVVLFARTVAGRSGELQLVAEQAQLAFTPALEARLRPILTELASGKAPPRITGISDAAPARDTIGWFRLACALPRQLPSNANLARDAAARRLAMADYALVLEQLGPCERRITRPD